MRKLAVGLALVAIGLGCGSDNLTKGQSSFKLDDSVDFGTVRLNHSGSKKITLINEGGIALGINEIDLKPPFRTTLQAPLVVARAASLEIELFYEPTELHADAADSYTLVLYNDSQDNPEAKVVLTGQSISPVLVSTPDTYDFGEVVALTEKDLQNIVIENTGNETVTVTDVQGLDPAIFDLNNADLRRAYAPGDKYTFTLTYHPSAGHDDSGTVVLVTDNDVQPALNIPLKAKCVAAIVHLCWQAPGSTEETCIPRTTPDGKTLYNDSIQFGALDEGQEKSVTLTLMNEGALGTDISGLIDGTEQTRDRTSLDANKCTSTPPPRLADFSFAPTAFAHLDGASPDGPAKQEMVITYRPHHECADDVADLGMVRIRVGNTMLQVDVKGASALGMARVADITLTVNRGTPQDISVENIGYGPLHVHSVELVQGDETNNEATHCATGCETRPVCPAPAEGNPKECNVYYWLSAPAPDLTVSPGADPLSGQTNSTVVGTIFVDPTVTGFGPVPTVSCVRATTDDLFHPVVCGTLKGLR